MATMKNKLIEYYKEYHDNLDPDYEASDYDNTIEGVAEEVMYEIEEQYGELSAMTDTTKLTQAIEDMLRQEFTEEDAHELREELIKEADEERDDLAFDLRTMWGVR